MDMTQSKLGVTYKDRAPVVVSGTPLEIIAGAIPVRDANGITILFSMDNVAAWATGTLEIFNNGKSVWLFEDQFLTLLESFFLYRNVRIGDKYSAVLTQTSGANVAAAIQISIGADLGVHE